jgi:NADPH:quinone reductase-like Zn-dependent oxidoreductase
MPIPKGVDLIDAAAIPEVWITAYLLLKLGEIKANDQVLVHAAASGVGTALIQLINFYNAKSICIASNQHKISFCCQ